MTNGDPTQSSPARLGQSQQERVDEALGPRYVGLDERTPAELVALLAKLAGRLRYIDETTGADAGTWEGFFQGLDAASAAAMMGSTDGATTPHLALVFAFAELYELPRAALNRLPVAHRDFFFREVLRFAPRPATPDRAHVVVECRKGAPPTRITPAHALSAGKDARKVERIYEPVRDVVVRPSAVAAARSVLVDGRTLRAALEARSADGLGTPLESPAQGWPAFGDASIPAATFGFAVAAPVLRMQAGSRRVAVALDLLRPDGAAVDVAALAAQLHAMITGPKGWIGPLAVTGSVKDGRAVLAFEVPAHEPPVVDHREAVHGGGFGVAAPVAQLLADPASDYLDLRGLRVADARVTVEVSGLAPSAVETDDGPVDPKRAFLPFGREPRRGARFMVGCPEALAKDLSRLTLTLRWQGLPQSFEAHFAGYGVDVTRGSFTASVSYQDGDDPPTALSGVRLFADAGDVREIDLTSNATSWRRPAADPRKARALLVPMGFAHPALRAAARLPFPPRRLAPTPPREGFVTFALESPEGFFAEHHRQVTARRLLAAAAARNEYAALNPPITPTLQGVAVAYAAKEHLPLDARAPSDDAAFFHVDAFGTRRESDATGAVPLVAPHAHSGELMLGLSGVGPGDAVSLLFQVVEGSADPEVTWPALEWSALGDDRWIPLRAGEVTVDTTRGLRTSGIVALTVPRAATTTNALLPTGLLWLRAAVASDAARLSRLVAVATNAVEVRFVDRGNDPAPLGAPAPAGTIARMKSPPLAVKAVAQPFASFGGRPAESAEAMATRAAERVRHRGRCVTAWDYERVVLDAFPELHRVRCVPHATRDRWDVPGHVLLIVVPDLRNTSVRDPRRPRADVGTLDRVRAHVRARVGDQVEVEVANPRYEEVRLAFRVRFRAGEDFGVRRDDLTRELTEFLSPWAADATREPTFGGRIYRSAVLDFVEERAYVDRLTDFAMVVGGRDVSDAYTATPDAIFAAAAEHSIEPWIDDP